MNPEIKLEEQVDRELRALPAPRAPATLAPRVLAAIAAQAAQSWYRRPWVEWPAGPRIVAVGLIVAFLSTLLALAPWRVAIETLPTVHFVSQVRGWMTDSLESVERSLDLALALRNALIRQFFYGTLAGVGLLMAVISTLGSLARRLILKEIQ